MNIRIYQDRYTETCNTAGTQFEQNATTIKIDFSELDFIDDECVKTIHFFHDDLSEETYIGDSIIQNDEFKIPKSITEYENVLAFVQITKEDFIWKTKVFNLDFYKSLDVDKTLDEDELGILQELILEVKQIKIDTSDEYKQLAEEETKKFNDNATAKTNTFNSNATSKETSYNENATTKLNEYNENHTIKMNAYNDNTTEKITEFNENAQDKIEEYDEHIEELDNIVSKKTASGESIYIDDALKYKIFDCKIDGNAKQTTTTGKNLLSKKLNEYSKTTDYITVDEASDNLLKLSVSSESTAYENVQILSITVESGKTYTLSAKIDGNTNSSIRVAKANSGASADNLGSAKNEQPLTFTCDGTYSHVGLFFYVSEGVKPTSNMAATFSNVQLEEGSVATDYEPYTGGEASPNPDYPQEITTIKDTVRLLQVGKNKLKIEDQVITSSGVTFTFKSGVCTLSGTASAKEIYCLIENTNFTINAGTYTFNNGSGNPYPYVSLYYDNAYHQINVYDDNGIKKFDLDKDIVVTKIRVYFNKNWIEKTTIFYPQIEEGSVATDYEEYKSNEYDIDLQDNELVKLTDDIKDTIEIDKFGNVSLNKAIRHLSLAIADMNNSEKYPGWKGLDVLKNDYPSVNTALGNFATLKSNISNAYNAFGVNTVSSSSGLLFIRSSFANLTQSEWIAKYPELILELYYSLQNTETIDLGTIQNFKTYEGVNHFFLETNIATNFGITYAHDLQKVISKQQSEIDELKTLLSSTATSALLLDNYESDLINEIESGVEQ